MKIIECPRDAMQSWDNFIATEVKIQYLNQLLKVGFDTLDFGSFVSPKAVPQMRDTAEVLSGLDLTQTGTQLLAITANLRGAEQACAFDEIRYLGYPLSISETFQKANTNKTIDESMELVAEIQNLCKKRSKTLVTYISMGFGNPYSDPYDTEAVESFTQRLVDLDISIISLADTVGVSNPENIDFLFRTLIPRFPCVAFGAHLHSTPDKVEEKLLAAYQAGCKRFDGAIRGFGGCPMAKDHLTGNMPTERILDFMEKQGELLPIDKTLFQQAWQSVGQVFI
jgi:hydroxymethylglutaryl-CoA lyase